MQTYKTKKMAANRSESDALRASARLLEYTEVVRTNHRSQNQWPQDGAYLRASYTDKLRFSPEVALLQFEITLNVVPQQP